MNKPPQIPDPPPHDHPEPDLPSIPGYDAVALIAKGGMGAVYEAFQQATGRRVALKLMLDATKASDSARRRFEREVELVARLQHPSIVPVIDSGIHHANHYYVMDLVDGRPLDHVLTPGSADPQRVLPLLASVCDTVNYAHQRGVLHRDLKPDNILLDNSDAPHLLDFGLATSFTPDLPSSAANHSLSLPGQLIGTLAYMAPEQARGDIDNVSVRTDVYALAAIAYELLTGRLPCPIHGPLIEVLNRIQTTDPPAPSSLRHSLSRDLDAVLLKALDKDPNRRYATASDLADELRRVLNHHPVHARRVGPLGRAVRWTQRNQRLAAVIGVALLALSTIGAVAVTQRYLAADAQREAGNAKRDASTLDDVLDQSLALLDPETTTAAGMPIEYIDAMLARVNNKQLPPQREADYRTRLGVAYLNYGHAPRARELLQRALELREATLPDNHPLIANAHHDLARALYFSADYTAADNHYQIAVDLRRADNNPRELAFSLQHLASTKQKLADEQAAEALHREAINIRQALAATDKSVLPDLAMSQNALGSLLRDRADLDDAETLFRAAINSVRAAPGENSFGLAVALQQLASTLTDLERYDEAEPLLTESISLLKKRVGDNQPRVATSLEALALLNLRRNQPARAESLAREALSIREQHQSPSHPARADSQLLLAESLLNQQRPAEAEPLIRAALDLRSSTPSPVDWQIAQAESLLGHCLLLQRHTTQAAPLLTRAHDTLLHSRGPEHPLTLAAARRLALLNPADAAPSPPSP